MSKPTALPSVLAEIDSAFQKIGQLEFERRELEAEVAELRKENAALKRTAAGLSKAEAKQEVMGPLSEAWCARNRATIRFDSSLTMKPRVVVKIGPPHSRTVARKPTLKEALDAARERIP